MGPRRDAYFLHIPKTAGTSLHTFLSRAGGADRVTEQLLWDDLIRDPEQITPTTRIVTGHFAGFLPLWLKQWPLILTSVREPMSRALSHINHVRRDTGHPLHHRAVGTNVAEYCEDPVLRTTVDNFQSRYLASLTFARVLLLPSEDEAPPNGMSVGFERALSALDSSMGLSTAAISALDIIDGVGIAEELGTSLTLFTRVLGLDELQPEPRLNVATDDAVALSELTGPERQALFECTRIDQVVYDHARDRFDRLCRQYDCRRERYQHVSRRVDDLVTAAEVGSVVGGD